MGSLSGCYIIVCMICLFCSIFSSHPRIMFILWIFWMISILYIHMKIPHNHFPTLALGLSHWFSRCSAISTIHQNQPTTNNPHTYTPQTAPIRTRHITAHVRRPPPQSVRLRRYLGQLVTRKSGIISPRPSARTSTCGRSSQRYVDFELRFARSKTTAHRDWSVCRWHLWI